MKTLLYIAILLGTSLILAINFLYYKPYYMQLLVAVIFIGFTFLIKRIKKFPIIIYIIIFVSLIISSTQVYKGYAKSVSDYCTNPLLNIPKIGLWDISLGYNPQVINDDQFEGIISFYDYYLYIFDLNTKEDHRVEIVTQDERQNSHFHQNEIISVEYLNGYVYVSKIDVTNATTDVLLIDINTREIMKTANDLTNYYSHLYKLNNSIYIENDTNLYQLTEDLTLSNEVSFIDGTEYMKAYKDYYLALRQFHTDEGDMYELRVYNKEFEYMQTLVTSSNSMLTSENSQGELLVSVNNNGVSFYVYDQQLTKINEHYIGNFNNYPVLSLMEYDNHYYIKYLSDTDQFRYNYTLVYDKSFNRENSCLVSTQYISRQNVFFTDDDVYLSINNLLYKINNLNYFKADNTLTYTEPINNNLIFYLAVLLYPGLCISFKQKK